MENNEDLKRWWEIMKKYYKVIWTIFFYTVDSNSNCDKNSKGR